MTTAGMGGFAKGFANGFVTTFTAAQQRKHEADQLTLKDRLDALREDRETRKKKQEEESQYLKDGENLAGMLGDPTYAPQLAKMRASGISSDSILDMARKGNLRPNKSYTTDKTVEMPNQQLDSTTGFKVPEVNPMTVPAGVIPVEKTALQPIPNTETASVQSIDPNTAATPAITDRAKVKEVATEQPLQEVAQTDPNEIQAKSKQFFSKNSDGPLMFVPDTVEEKLENLQTEVYKWEEAKRNGDSLLAAQQERKVEAIKKAQFIKATQEAQLNGKNIVNYAIVDNKGKLVSFVPTERDENNNLLNASTEINGRKNPISLSNDQRLVRVNDDQVKQTWNIQEQFAKQSKDYKVSSMATAEAVSISRKMTDILARNPSVATSTQGIMVYAQGVFEEAKAVQKVFEQSTMVANENLKDGGDPYKVSAAVAKMDQTMKDLELQKLSLSDKNAQDALDKTLFENYKVLAAYKLAQANGQTGQAAGEKDIQRFLALVGDKTKSPEAIRRILANQVKEQIAKNDNMKDDLNRDVSQWESSLGFIPNVSADELGSMIKDKADREYFMQVLKMKDESLLQTSLKANEADAAVQPVQTPVEETQYPTLTRDQAGVELWNNAKPGTVFVDENGNKKVKR